MSDDWCAHAVRIADVRCWSRLELSLRPGLILVWGPNGAGKTSLVEAISLACIGGSPRTSREAEVVRHGAEAAHVELELSGPDGLHARGIGYAPGRGRRLTLDGTPVRALSDWTAPGAVLIFVPDELRIVKGPPAARRRHLDRLLEAAVPGYHQASVEYRQAVSQRNALLRRVRAQEASPAELSPWERQLVPRAAELVRARRTAMRDLSEPFQRWLEALGGGKEGTLHLESSPSSVADVPDADLDAALRDALDARRPRDIAAAQTLSGPHRDDVSIRSGALDLRTSGSQGEQRTAALALTMSHRDVLTAAVARPILLLDDALSELDPERRARVLHAVTEGGQALITTADPAAAAEAGALSAQVLRVRNGTVMAE